MKSFKKITSLSLGISFLIMSYTGVMLFICPHGRVAYWADWHLFGLNKSQYGELHTTSMVAFLFFAIWHIYYNWKPIVSYLKSTSKKVSFTKKEFLLALGLNIIFIVGTLFLLQPFKGFLDLGEDIKESWTVQYGEPPYGHAEESKLKVFYKKMSIDVIKANKSLTDNKIIFKEEETLKTIARNNGLSPSDIYKLVKTDSNSDVPSKLGRKTIQDLSNMKKIDLKKAIKLLKEKGLGDVTPESKIKNIADELDMTPSDIYELLVE